jgi:hypothetical protein
LIQTFFLLNRAGLCYLDRSFSPEIEVDKTLISGFLAALNQLGSEVLKHGDEIAAIDYKRYRIVHVAKGDVLAVAVIDKTDDVHAIRKVITILLSLFVETYDPGTLKMFDDELFEGFRPTIDEVLQGGSVSAPYEEYTSPSAEISIETLAEALGGYDVLSRLMRLLLTREPVVLICEDSQNILWNLWMLVPHRRCLMAEPNLSVFQMQRLSQEITKQLEAELNQPDSQKLILFVPEANKSSLEALGGGGVHMGWVASRTHFPKDLKKGVSNIILEDKAFFRYIFGERVPISFSDLSFESNLLKENREKGFSQEASMRFIRMRERELDNKADLAQAVLDANPEIVYADLLKRTNIKKEEFELVIRLLAAERGMNVSHVLMSAAFGWVVKARPVLATTLGDPKRQEALLKEANPATLAIIMMADGKKTMNQLLRNISPTLKAQLNKASLWENLRRLADLGVLELIPRDDARAKLSHW